MQTYTIAPFDPDFPFQHGVALCWHKGRLFSTFARNTAENTETEQTMWCVSNDAGETWTKPAVMRRGSHGALLSYDGEMLAYNGVFCDMTSADTLIYRYNREDASWDFVGDFCNFWPCCPPIKMTNGNWIMSGLRLGGNNPAAVAISHGDYITDWDVVGIPTAEPGNIWGESTIYFDEDYIVNISRCETGENHALASVSQDCGKTWCVQEECGVMAASKPFAGNLSTGQPYQIRNPIDRTELTIQVQGDNKIRRTLASDSGSVCYPYAVEHEGNLYVGYSDNEERYPIIADRGTWNNNAIKLLVIPISELT
jgi:hypothetical protein